ncbi:MAG TPA: hypothetical protein VGX76_08030, partial [Pirellulales bacterium]|nr:hypothetical protein [Pirellulales bacterium]
SESPASAPAVLSVVNRFLLWLGKFHLLLIHFPIALVIAAGFAEVLSFWQQTPNPSVRFCLWLAALAAIPTAGFGWLFAAAGNGAGSPQLLTAHRWLGTAAAVCLVITAIAAERDASRGRRGNFVRLLLTLCIFMTAIAAHFGGLLARGADFFNY